MIPVPGVFYYIFIAVISCVALLPYAVDRALAPRLSPVIGTLVFHCRNGYRAIPSGIRNARQLGLAGIHAKWRSSAATASGNHGTRGCHLSDRVARSRGKPCAGARTGLSRLPHRFHQFRIGLFDCGHGGGVAWHFSVQASRTVRVASFSPADSGPPASIHACAIGSFAASRQRRRWPNSITQRVLGKIICCNAPKSKPWQARRSFSGLKAQRPCCGKMNLPCCRRGESLAAQDHLYLGMALASWSPGQAHPLQNKLVLIDPSGNIVWQYLKAHPTPGPESTLSVASDGKLRFLDTHYGRISAAICYDMDFPRLIAQAGRHRTDILLSPASDWRAIDPVTRRLRAFEPSKKVSTWCDKSTTAFRLRMTIKATGSQP